MAAATLRSGRRRHIPENNNMWAVLKTDTRTPILEFDFLGSDAWENYGSGLKEEGDMTGGEKLEFRKRQVSMLPDPRANDASCNVKDKLGIEQSGTEACSEPFRVGSSMQSDKQPSPTPTSNTIPARHIPCSMFRSFPRQAWPLSTS